MSDDLEALARRAAGGDREALDALVRELQDDVYRLALRMLADPHAAADATQEVLVKVVTRLSAFRGESSVRTWAWRIAVNHVLSMRRSPREHELPFEGMEQLLAAEQGRGAAPDEPLLEQEVKLGCTHSMVMCLDRGHRMAFVLGAVFELSGDEAAELLEIEPAAYRKRLSRARERMRAFMERNCGLVDEAAACRCRSQIRPSADAGMMDPERPVYALHPVRARAEPDVQRTYEAIETGERYLAVLRSHPDDAAPDSVREGVRRQLATI